MTATVARSPYWACQRATSGSSCMQGGHLTSVNSNSKFLPRDNISSSEVDPPSAA
jgi:hypothetical protein